MLTFDDYKAKISIIQILEDLGYKQDISKGKVSPVFKLTDGAGTSWMKSSSRILIVYKNTTMIGIIKVEI